MSYPTFVISLAAAFFAAFVAVIVWTVWDIDPLVAFLIAAVVGMVTAEVLAWLYIRRQDK